MNEKDVSPLSAGTPEHLKHLRTVHVALLVVSSVALYASVVAQPSVVDSSRLRQASDLVRLEALVKDSTTQARLLDGAARKAMERALEALWRQAHPRVDRFFPPILDSSGATFALVQPWLPRLQTLADVSRLEVDSIRVGVPYRLHGMEDTALRNALYSATRVELLPRFHDVNEAKLKVSNGDSALFIPLVTYDTIGVAVWPLICLAEHGLEALDALTRPHEWYRDSLGVFQVRISGIGWRAEWSFIEAACGKMRGTFGERFGLVASAASIESMSPREALRVVEDQVARGGSEIEILSVAVNRADFRVIGVLVLLVLQLYFALHYRHSKARIDQEKPDFPWIALYQSWPARVVYLVSLVMPVLAVIQLGWILPITSVASASLFMCALPIAKGDLSRGRSWLMRRVKFRRSQ